MKGKHFKTPNQWPNSLNPEYNLFRHQVIIKSDGQLDHRGISNLTLSE